MIKIIINYIFYNAKKDKSIFLYFEKTIIISIFFSNQLLIRYKLI